MLKHQKGSDLHELMGAVALEAEGLFGCERASLWVNDIPSNEILTIRTDRSEARIGSTDDITGYSMNQSSLIITTNLQKYVKFHGLSESSVETANLFKNAEERKSAMLIPIKDDLTSLPLGVLEIVNSS